MFKLSKRLATVMSMTSTSEHFWDLCCDHGQLGIAIAQNNLAKNIHFVDIVPSIIHKLAETLQDTYIPKGIKTHLYSTDATKLKLNEKATISIAGVGGLKAIEILQNLGFEHEYILTAHGHLNELRDFLIKNGLKLHEEKLVKDGKHTYEIMKVSRYGTYEITLVGSLLWKKVDDVSIQYLEKNIFHLKRHLTYENDAFSELLLNNYEEIKNKFNKL